MEKKKREMMFKESYYLPTLGLKTIYSCALRIFFIWRTHFFIHGLHVRGWNLPMKIISLYTAAERSFADPTLTVH